jgi:hypothetical protein
MKLAIIGSSPVALEAAIRFHAHGAALTWFKTPEASAEELAAHFIQDGRQYCSALGWSLLGQQAPAGAMSWQQWQQQYALPLAQILASEHPVRALEVVSVTKRFLSKGEEIPGKSRFHDLFRIIFLVNPAEFVAEQKEHSPETYARLSSEMLHSLQNSLEMYEDFDLVLDLRQPTQGASLAASGRALGEGKIPQDKLFYGVQILKRLEQLTPEDPGTREIALMGSGELAALTVIKLSRWLQDERNRLFVVSTEADPFAQWLGECREEFRVKLLQVFSMMDEEFDRARASFHHKLREWQALDDFVQVKYPKPAEPIPRLVFFSGHNATAVDQLIDRPRLFVTLEKPDFRPGIKQPENNHLELKTIGVDEIFAARALERRPLNELLEPDETGFFSCSPAAASKRDGWQRDLEKLKGIEDEIFKLFSPAHSS